MKMIVIWENKSKILDKNQEIEEYYLLDVNNYVLLRNVKDSNIR
jgi:hypothetical protein